MAASLLKMVAAVVFRSEDDKVRLLYCVCLATAKWLQYYTFGIRGT